MYKRQVLLSVFAIALGFPNAPLINDEKANVGDFPTNKINNDATINDRSIDIIEINIESLVFLIFIDLINLIGFPLPCH